MKSKNIIVKSFVVCGLVLSLTACSNKQDSKNNAVTSQLVTSEVLSDSVSKANGISENQKLSGKCNNIKLGNKTLEVPFSIDDLGDGYSISSSSIEYSKNDNGTFNAKFDIIHNGVVILKARIKDVADYSQKDYIDLSCMKIVDIEQQYVPKNGEVLSVNNTAVGDKPDEAIKNLGAADKTTKCSYIYYNEEKKDNGVFFVFDDYQGIYYIRWYCAK